MSSNSKSSLLLQIKDFKLKNQIFGHQMLPKNQQVLLAQKTKQKERQNDDLRSLRTKIELFAHNQVEWSVLDQVTLLTQSHRASSYHTSQ